MCGNYKMKTGGTRIKGHSPRNINFLRGSDQGHILK